MRVFSPMMRRLASLACSLVRLGTSRPAVAPSRLDFALRTSRSQRDSLNQTPNPNLAGQASAALRLQSVAPSVDALRDFWETKESERLTGADLRRARDGVSTLYRLGWTWSGHRWVAPPAGNDP